MTDGIDVELFPYQVESKATMNRYGGRNLLALDMGLGKTLVTLKWLDEHPEALPALVVCPASVKYNWSFEALHYTGMRASICEGRSPPVFDERFCQVPKLTIANYDILKGWLPYFEKCKFKTIVFDECQNLQNIETQRTQASFRITLGTRHKPKHVFGLSGTPLTNRVYEIWPMLHILWPESFQKPLPFYQEFCGPKFHPRWGWDYTGASNLDKLNKTLREKGMIRYRKEDVLKDLPDKVWKTVPCQMSDPDEYHSAQRDFLGWLKRTMAHRVKGAEKAEPLAKVGYMLRLAAKLKLKAVVDWANEFLSNTDEKLVLFATHQKAIDVLLRRIEFKSTLVDGGVTGEQRQLAVEQFRKDPATRLFVGSPAARTGLNGLQIASECGVVEPPWAPGHLTQLADRLHRIGQKNTVFVNMFVAIDTYEEEVYTLLRNKQKTVSAVLDGGETPADINIYEELLRIIEGRLL